jgi:hypothetical protein
MSNRLVQIGFAVSICVSALTGCSETTTDSPSASQPVQQAPLRTGDARDEQACELAVTQQTNNPDVMTVSSEFSQANTVVVLSVGQQGAKWRCLVSNGVVAEVSSLTNEGTL